TTGPVVTAVLLGNTSAISLSLRTVSPSNTTGKSSRTHIFCGPPSMVRVHLRLNQSLHLCGNNDTNTDCCQRALCILEALQVSACVDGTPQASLLIQAKIHALLVPANPGSDNKTVIPNQVYQPLGPCPCDLTSGACDILCCCDTDCSNEDLKLFSSHCLPGPFGGQVSPAPDYQCSVQSTENSPDWFPFLCVNSPPENNPYLGHFYKGDTIAPKPGPSFQSPVLPAPVPVDVYIQGNPIFTLNGKYFTVPQVSVLGLCVNNAPVAFLKNFNYECTTLLLSCPTGYPLQTLPNNLTYCTLKITSHLHFLICLPVSDGLCSTAGMKPVLFGENSTSGCLLPVSRQNLTQCSLLRSVADLIAATYVAKSGNPDFLTMADWINIIPLNSSTAMENSTSTCYDIPAHLHIHIWSVITSVVEGVPQREIRALQVSPSNWALDCGGGAISSCVDPEEPQLFSITSSVTFIDIPINTRPPKTRFYINFTEYDCNRNDVCWPELAFPITKYYTGEPFSQSLAKGMILVFFFIVASVLGTPWRQIRQAWNNSAH
uniref:Tectonic family member 2 n=1 Tax=Neolamprologus brichardi TaxID=32507 RepID=A0A3Q4GR50_NEOBR